MSIAALTLVLVFMAGYATQRGTTCAVSAAQEIVLERRATRLLGFLLCAFVSLGLMAVAHLVGYKQVPMSGEPFVWGFAMLGGCLFGMGAYVNGRCAFGTIAKLGSGEMARIGTLAGFLGGSVLTAHSSASQRGVEVGLPIIAVNASTMLILAIFGIIGIGRHISARAGLADSTAGWSALRAMLIIGAVNGALLILMQGWSYTSLLMALAQGHLTGLGWPVVIAIVMVVGAVAGAIIGQTFRFDVGSQWQWVKTLCGGVLMGCGAGLVPGGNDRMLMLGFPLLLPNLILAYAAMMSLLIVTVALERRYRGHLA
jgi:uncharacterized protein